VAASRDSTTATGNDEPLLSQFVAARDAGNERAARDAWYALVTANLPRIQAWVRIEGRDYLSGIEFDDAESLAIEKIIIGLLANFNGSSMGEWVNAARRAVYFACKQTWRDASQHTNRTAPLHGTGDDGEFSDGQTAAVNKAALNGAAAASADEQEADGLDELRERFFELLPQVAEGRREVLELQHAGYTTEQICVRLGKKPDAVYQAGSRGMSDIRRLGKEGSA